MTQNGGSISAKITPEVIHVVKHFYGLSPAEIKTKYLNNAAEFAKFPNPTKEQQNEFDLKFTCVACNEGKKASAGGGMSNLLSHLTSAHMELYKSELANFGTDPTQRTINKYWDPSVPKEVKNVFEWIEFIVDNDLPLCCVEKESIRRHVKMEKELLLRL